MKKFVSILTIMAMVMFLIIGCVVKQQTGKGVRTQTRIKPEPKHISDYEGAYYHFLEAQLERKKGNLETASEHIHKALQQDSASSYLLKELCMIYFQQKKNREALEVVENLLKKDPEDIEALILQGRIRQELKQFHEAKQTYEKVIAKDPKRENIYLLLGRLYMQDKEDDPAYRVYKNLVELFPGSYTGHFFMGKILVRKGKLDEAEQEFKQTLKLQPDLEEPRSELIQLYKKRGLDQKVVETYNEILDNNPDNTGASLELGLYYHESGKVKDSEAILMPLGSRSLTDSSVIQKFVQLYLNPKRYKDALTVLNYMLKGAPDSSDLNYFAGVAYGGLEQDDEALTHFNKVTHGSRFYQNAVVHIAFTYQQQGDVERAIRFLNEVRKKLPKDPDILLYLGSFYEETEQYENAVQVLKQGIEIDAKHVRLHFRLGVVYDKIGKKDQTIDIMRTVIRLDPKNANALNYLGYTYADLGTNLDEAEKLIRKALDYRPDDGYITDSLGWVFYKKGLYEKAVEMLKRAIKLVPTDPIVLEHLGDAYLKINNRTKALEYYNRSLKHQKKDKEKIKKKIQTLTEKGSES